MNSIKILAQRAGLFYGLAASAAPFAYLYVPDRLPVQNDALATADRVRASEGLLRAAIFGEPCGATPQRTNELKLLGVPGMLAGWVTAVLLLIKGPRPRAVAEAEAEARA